MATELRLNVSFQGENGSYYKPGAIQFSGVTIAQAAQGSDGFIQNIGTSEEDVTFAVTTHGYLFMRNLDTSHYIKYGPSNGGSMVEFGRLKAGELAILRVAPGITLRAIADTAACNVWFHMEND